MPSRVSIISTGQELVLGRTPDTNAAFLASELSGRGFEVLRLAAVGDTPGALRAELLHCMQEGDLVIVTGGLGPTGDDHTCQEVADALDRELVMDQEARRALTDRLERIGVQVTAAQLNQARFPAGASTFPNPRGTARGFACAADDTRVVVMPGVPSEMKAMFGASVLPFLTAKFGSEPAVASESVHIFPISEPEADRRLEGMTEAGRNPSVGITVRDGVITIGLRAVGDHGEHAEELLERDLEFLEDRFGDLIFGRGETTLAGALSRELERAGRTVAVAESITGGLIGHMLVNVPGISRFFLLDVVAYSNDAKVRQLEVPRAEIERHGAVSPEVAESMARGACAAADAQLALSTTGIAGPTGATPQKPVGLVYFGVCLEGEVRALKLNIRGDRRRVKDRAAKHALNMGRLALQNGVDFLEQYPKI